MIFSSQWRRQAIVLGRLIPGIVIALGYHLFYDYLTGHEAPPGPYEQGGIGYSKQ